MRFITSIAFLALLSGASLIMITPALATNNLNYNESTLVHVIELALDAGSASQALENAFDLLNNSQIKYDLYTSIREDCNEDIMEYDVFIASPALADDKPTYNESTLEKARELAFKAGKAGTSALNALDRYDHDLISRDQFTSIRKQSNEDIRVYNEFIESVLPEHAWLEEAADYWI
jgi:hypothetical protein